MTASDEIHLRDYVLQLFHLAHSHELTYRESVNAMLRLVQEREGHIKAGRTVPSVHLKPVHPVKEPTES